MSRAKGAWIMNKHLKNAGGRPRRAVPRVKRSLYITEPLWDALATVARTRAARIRGTVTIADLIEQLCTKDPEVARELARGKDGGKS